MANPNIVQVTSILGNNFLGNLESTGTLLVVNNAASSGKIYKLNNLTLSNYESGNVYSATVTLFENDDLGGNAVSIVTSLEIPAKSSISVIDKSTSIYMKEDQSLGVTANSASKISVIASWEEISQ